MAFWHLYREREASHADAQADRQINKQTGRH